MLNSPPSSGRLPMLYRLAIGLCVLLLLSAALAPASHAQEPSADEAAATLLNDAIRERDLAEVQRLAGDVDAPTLNQTLYNVSMGFADPHGEDPVRLVEVLLDAGASPDGPCYSESTPLAAAASSGFVETVRALLAAGADPDLGAHPPLLTALSSFERDAEQATAVVASLLEAGAALTAQDSKGRTVPMMAAAVGDGVLLEAALDAGATVNAAFEKTPGAGERTGGFFAALDLARLYGRSAIEQQLLELGAMEGQAIQALFQAADGPDPAAPLALLEAGADPRASIDGLTLLMVAAHHGHRAVVEAALAAGADANATAGGRYSGTTALALAQRRGHDEVADLLVAAGAADQPATAAPPRPGCEEVVEEVVVDDGF